MTRAQWVKARISEMMGRMPAERAIREANAEADEMAGFDPEPESAFRRGFKVKIITAAFKLLVRGENLKLFNRYAPLLGLAWLVAIATCRALGQHEAAEALTSLGVVVDLGASVPPDVHGAIGEIVAAVFGAWGLARKLILPFVKGAWSSATGKA